MFPRPAENPFDYQLIVHFEAGSGEQTFDSRRQVIEQSFDRCFIFTVANNVGSAAFAGDEPQGIENDRFAGTGFTGEDVKAGLELQHDLIDDRKILNAKLAQHRSPSLALSPLEFFP